MNFVQALCVTAIYLGFGFLEFANGHFKASKADRNDLKLEAAMIVMLIAAIQPTIFTLVNWLGAQYFPQYRNAMAGLPVWAMLVILLLVDDLTQYLWHRASHTPLLWPLHRAHHSAAYMGIRVVYRNNFFYYALMPGVWIAAATVYLGFGWVVVAYTVSKMLVIIGAHSTVRWDEPLYRIRALRPLMWVLERTISTPATHYAHHAITMEDGIGHYRGNYGNMLFLWDMLLGTALITRKYPAGIGLQDDITYGKENWLVQLVYPLLKSKRSHSALGKERIIIE